MVRVQPIPPDVRVVQRPSTPVFPTGNTGSIPVTDAPGLAREPALSASYNGQYLRLSNGECGFDSRRRFQLTAAPWQPVLGTAMAHSHLRDGSIPSAATSRAPRGFHSRARNLPSGCSSGARARRLGRRGRWCDSSHPDRMFDLSGCSSVVRARGRGPRGRWCDSSHSDDRHRPEDGTRDYESRWLRFESSRWLQFPSGCSSAAERVGDNHDVAGAIPAIQTRQIAAIDSVE